VTKVKLMTQAEYAEHRGVSAVAVHKAVKAGRISLIAGKIDPAVADIQWAQNTRPRADRKPTAALAQPADDRRPEPIIVANPVASDDNDDYWVSRAKRERAEAAIAEMRRAELEGKLIRADVIRAAWARKISSARDALLQMPHRLSPVLAAESDMERIGQLLDEELRQALLHLSQEQPQPMEVPQ
jgi:hypothetical protein